MEIVRAMDFEMLNETVVAFAERFLIVAQVLEEHIEQTMHATF